MQCCLDLLVVGGSSKSSKDNAASDAETQAATSDTLALTLDSVQGGGQIVMKKYAMLMSDQDCMGEGTSSICRKARELQTGRLVAIKVYKTKPKRKQDPAVLLTKFKRQIAVLKELQQPFQQPDDPDFWCEQLANTSPSKVFMQLLDYSTDASGEPGPDTEDGVMYVITELASYSLKDYIKIRRDEARPMSKDNLRSITTSIMLCTAALHSKGLVHLDLKPENLMLFDGVLKLIDLDGCVNIGSVVSIDDSSLSFSPCYCAPEWAKFLIDESDAPTITVSADLDVWSVGMTLAELVLLDAALKPTFTNFMRHGRSHQEAGFHFMDWLSGLSKWPIPEQIQKFDTQFAELLSECLLVQNQQKRSSLAKSLSHAYVLHAECHKAPTGPINDPENGMPAEASRVSRRRLEDHSSDVLYKGVLWKLNADGSLKESAHWLKRDMWIATNGSLCYFSMKEGKRLVMLDGHHLARAEISRLEGAARDYAFKITTSLDHDEDETCGNNVFYLASECEEDLKAWISTYEKLKGEVLRTFELGPNMAQDLHKFKLAVKNRRMKLQDAKDGEAIFKERLWKVKAGGDRTKAEDWLERDMWISHKGSLVYFSKKEDKDLMYYAHSDLEHATFDLIPSAEAFRSWAFQVQLPAVGDLEFSPGEFAAESEEMRNRWMSEFRKLQACSTL